VPAEAATAKEAASAKAAPAPANTPAAPPQVAAAGTAALGSSIVKFPPGAAELPSGAQPVLDGVAAKLLASDGLRVQLIAHATGDADQAMEARRVSLARAVAVRAYLIDKGVRSLRVDVRALGNRADDGPVGDQVDLVLVSQ
jgi:outer membrane protein OmpA-like peptidoglycan-associated protein